MEKAKLNVVVPLFNEIEIVEQLHTRLVASCNDTGLDYQIIYIDDGSSDGTADWIDSNAVEYARHCQDTSSPITFGGYVPTGEITLLRLSRNFGQPAAILAGLAESDGDCVVVMDGDLQDPPELIPDLIDKWKSGFDVVIAQRKSRKETLLRGLAFKTFHKLFKYLSDSAIPPNTGTFCLLNRQAAISICQLPESHRFFPGLRAWVGFKQTSILFDRHARAGGEPKQTFVRLLRYALDAVFGFSFKPLRVLTGTGVLICCLSFVLASWFVFKRMVGWEDASIGFTTLTCAVFGLGGFQLIGMGILGEYIGRIYDEVKGRPQYMVASAKTVSTAPTAFAASDTSESETLEAMPMSSNQRKAG